MTTPHHNCYCHCSHSEQPHGGALADLEVPETRADGGGRRDGGGERPGPARGDHLGQCGEAQQHRVPGQGARPR